MGKEKESAGMWQGILGVFLREPLADWQREARLLRASFRARGGEPPPDEDTHVALKVLHLTLSTVFLVVMI